MAHRWFLATLVAVLFAFVSCKKEEIAGERPTDSTVDSRTTTTDDRKVATVTVHMKIFGLCSLVDAAAAGEAVRTIVVGNARSMGHIPMIKISATGDAPPDGFIRHCNTDAEDRKCYDYFELKGYELVLDKSPGWDAALNPPLTPMESYTQEQCPTLIGSGADSASLHWLPRLSEVLDVFPAPRTKASYVGRGASPENVSARMALVGGTGLFSVFDAGKKFRWRFQDTASNFKHIQAIADYLRFSFKMNVEADKRWLSFWGRPIDKPDETPEELFRVPVPDAKLELSLANVPLDAPFADPESIKLGHNDLHFAFHYRMIEGNPTKYTPKAIGVCATIGGISDSLYCGPDRLP